MQYRLIERDGNRGVNFHQQFVNPKLVFDFGSICIRSYYGQGAAFMRRSTGQSVRTETLQRKTGVQDAGEYKLKCLPNVMIAPNDFVNAHAGRRTATSNWVGREGNTQRLTGNGVMWASPSNLCLTDTSEEAKVVCTNSLLAVSSHPL